MALEETDNLKLPFILPSQAQKHVPYNEALRALDALVHLTVLDRNLASPPALPAEGQRYIVAAGATGAWAGKTNQVAAFQDGAWAFYPPHSGWLCWVSDEPALTVWTGTAWTETAASIAALQGLSRLGVGTAADATNPFAAKLNKTLWAAKTAAEGGDGDLRFTFNKETTADILSLLFQTGFSGRAELGLIGSDNLCLKVSPDGSAWTMALSIDKTSGALQRILAGAGTSISANDGISVYNNAGQARLGLYGTGAGFDAYRFSTNQADAPNNNFRRARGTPDAPAAVAGGDRLLTFNALFYDGSAYQNAGALHIEAIAATPSAAARDGRWLLQLGLGSSSTAEIARFDHATGFSMFGANPVVDQDRHLRLRAYAVGVLPSAATAAGQTIFCSDLGGGGGPLVSDGTAWRRTGAGGQQTVAGDAAFTLTTLVSAENQKHAGTLTANRAITLSTTNAYAGARFRVTRTGSGAFNLDLGGLKNLATNSWGETVYDGSAWYLAGAGSL